MNRVRATTGVVWFVVALAVSGASGCIEWLEVDLPVQRPDDAEEARAPAPPTHLPGMAVLPNTPPQASASGPVVPQTPGLRVPDGYWTRARLDQADLLLSHTWAVFQPVGYSPDGKPRGMVLRLQAHGPPDGTRRAPALRGVIRVATPAGTVPSQMVGLSFGPDALDGSTVSLRISKGTLWHVVPERLFIDALDTHMVKGTLEGSARAGKRAKRSRRFRASFLALRAGDVTDTPARPGRRRQ